MQVITGRVEERRRTDVVAGLDQGNLKAERRVGGREASGSDAHGNFAYFHSKSYVLTS